MKIKNYSQLNQDLYALDFFRRYPPRSKIFLDCGAFDGIGFSNTRLLYEQGWSGVCVEPCLRNYKKLEKLYAGTRVRTVRAAAADFEGTAELNVNIIPGEEEWGADAASLDEKMLERWPGYKWEKELVRVTTLDSILEDANLETVDFLSVDVEGQELAVLRGFNLEKYQPALIVVEYSSAAERTGLLGYLKPRGYFCWMDNRQDLFMVRGKPVACLPLVVKGLLIMSGMHLGRFTRLLIHALQKRLGLYGK